MSIAMLERATRELEPFLGEIASFLRSGLLRPDVLVAQTPRIHVVCAIDYGEDLRQNGQPRANHRRSD